jgi:hypothetical protein
MSDDWQIGDLAVCVDASKHNGSPYPAPPLVEGRSYTVSFVAYGLKGIGVVEASCEPAPAFKIERFRKIRPDAQERCEEEFETLLKRSKTRQPA